MCVEFGKRETWSHNCGVYINRKPEFTERKPRFTERKPESTCRKLSQIFIRLPQAKNKKKL